MTMAHKMCEKQDSQGQVYLTGVQEMAGHGNVCVPRALGADAVHGMTPL